MRKNIMLAAIIILGTAGLTTTGTAFAGGKEGTIGVGAEVGLNGETGGASVNYDAGAFHAGGFLGFFDGGGANDTDFTFGGRFYYHVHQTGMTDFGVGGGLGFYSLDHRGVGAQERSTLLFFEPGIQIRAFIASNVALSFTAGISIGLVDAAGTVINGQLNAGAGIHYYFF